MRTINWRTVAWMLLLNISFGICRTTAAPDNSGKTIYDDYDYSDEDNKTDDAIPPSLNGSTINTDPPYFEKPDLEMHAATGKSVVLNCDVKNFNSASNAIMWYKGKTLISVGRDPVINRYESIENNAIRIRTVEAGDAGDYYCVVLPQNVKLHISLMIDGLYIFCNGIDFTNRTMNTKQGASFNCECRTSATGDVALQWSLNGVRADKIVTKVDNGKFWIDTVDAENEGIYQCLADDKSSKPAIAALMIHVNYEPKVSTHRHHVNTIKGSDAELYCDYKANPIGITRWHKMGQELKYSDKYSIKNVMHHARNRTILTIKDVADDDLGEYECHIENTIGTSQVKIYLIYEPETPQFEDMEINNNIVKLHWLVRSVQPLSEAVLDYMLMDTGRWSTVSVLHTKRHADKGMWKITHEMELMPGKWQARVKTRNTVGWSKFSAEHNFIIREPDDDNKADNDINHEIPPQDMIMAAGVGLAKGSNKSNASSTLQVVPSISAAVCSILLLLLNNGIFKHL